MHPPSLRYTRAPITAFKKKKSVAAPKQSLCGENCRGGRSRHLWLEEKKSGSDVGLIMLIPTSLYGNTSSTPIPQQPDFLSPEAKAGNNGQTESAGEADSESLYKKK